MAREAVSRVLESAPGLGLSHLEFRVLVYLADRLNAKTGQLNPSPERLARDCGLDPESGERSVRRVIDRLEAKGIVRRGPGRHGGRKAGGRYPTRAYSLRADLMGRQPDEAGDVPTTGVHSPARLRPFLPEVQAHDDGAELVPGEGIVLSHGVCLPTVQAVRKFLEHVEGGGAIEAWRGPVPGWT
jgi:hypothetical protein